MELTPQQQPQCWGRPNVPDYCPVPHRDTARRTGCDPAVAKGLVGIVKNPTNQTKKPSNTVHNPFKGYFSFLR